MTEWPDTIWILTNNCNISGDFGYHTDGWPDTVSEWVSFCLPDKNARREWWTMYYRLSFWENDNIQLFNDILGVTSRFDKWNELVRIRYNLTFALLGYTDNQSQQILDLLPIVEASVSFQKCTFVLHDHGSYYSLIERNAQTKTSHKAIPRRPVQVYGKRRR
jgi:hypothetical protein